MEHVRAAAASGPSKLAELLLPIDAGLDRLPEVTATRDEVNALTRGQFVRASSPVEILPDQPIRVRDELGRLVAIARLKDGHLAPDKVLIDQAAASGAGRA